MLRKKPSAWEKENLPPWFDLLAYEKARIWTPSRWRHEIYIRILVKHHIDSACEYNQDESENKIIGNVGLEETWKELNFLLPQEKLGFVASPAYNDLINKVNLILEFSYLVTSIRIKDAISLYREFLELPAFKNSMIRSDELNKFINENFDKIVSAGPEVGTAMINEYLKGEAWFGSETLDTVFGSDYSKLPYKNITSHYGFSDGPEIVLVNLNASDDALKAAFNVWLDQQRLKKKPPLPILSRGQQRDNDAPLEERKQGEKRNLRPGDYERWVDWKLFPYLDINFWRKANNKTGKISPQKWRTILSLDTSRPTIPDISNLADWLFSDEAMDLLTSAIILDKKPDS